MAALDVSHLVEASEDSPDLRAFKALVYDRAQRGKKSYGFCAQIDRELEILGIKKEKPVTVRVTTSHPFIFDVKVLPSKLLDKSEDEQKAALIKVMGDLTLSGTSMQSTTIQVPVESVVTMELVTAPSRKTRVPGETGRDARPGYMWRYIGEEGRVLHEIPDHLSGYTTGYAACGKYVYSESIRESTTRAEDRHCPKCERRGGSRS